MADAPLEINISVFRSESHTPSLISELPRNRAADEHLRAPGVRSLEAQGQPVHLRNLCPRGSLGYLIFTGVTDDSQTQLQTRKQAPEKAAITEYLRASSFWINPRGCSWHQSQRCRDVSIYYRESAAGISNSARIYSSAMQGADSSMRNRSPSCSVFVWNRVSWTSQIQPRGSLATGRITRCRMRRSWRSLTDPAALHSHF